MGGNHAPEIPEFGGIGFVMNRFLRVFITTTKNIHIGFSLEDVRVW